MNETGCFLAKRRGTWRLEMILLLALFISASLAGTLLIVLKNHHDRQAHLAATATVLEEGENLLNAICTLGLCSSTNPPPSEWRRFSTVVDSAFAVRKDVQSITVSRNGITVFQRQAEGVHADNEQLAESLLSTPAGQSVETRVTPGTIEIGEVLQPVFVMTRTFKLAGGDTVSTEATLRHEAVGVEEKTARALVSSLFFIAMTLLIISFTICALVIVIAVTRDRKRVAQARREEHLAFSGVLANGILHDFRNPMSAVRLDAQMLGREMARAERFRPERVKDLANRIARTMARMDKIFQEFLFLSKPADEQPEAVHLSQVVRECVDTLAPRMEQADVSVQVTLDENLPPVSAYPFALRRALLNVLMNAIQFSPKTSEIVVVLKQTGDRLQLDVLDKGPGIKPDQCEKIFNLFESGRPGGTGLGLFLARTAIRRCGGDLTAHNQKEGGADLRMTLPIVSHYKPMPQATTNENCV